jgi:hypothetical protein
MTKIKIIKVILFVSGILYVSSLLIKNKNTKAYYSIFPMSKKEYVELKRDSEKDLSRLMTTDFYSNNRKDDLLKLKERLQILKSEGEKNGYN